MRLPLAFLAGALCYAAVYQAMVPIAHAGTPDPWVEPYIPPMSMTEIICSFDWDCSAAVKVAFCESSLNPKATDGVNVGLFQIAPRFHTWRLEPGESLFDPWVNARVAHEIYREQGRKPWPVCGRWF